MSVLPVKKHTGFQYNVTFNPIWGGGGGGWIAVVKLFTNAQEITDSLKNTNNCKSQNLYQLGRIHKNTLELQHQRSQITVINYISYM